MAIFCFVIFLYMATNAKTIEYRYMTGFHAYEYVIAIIGVLLVMEGCRRVSGMTVPILCIIFILYTKFGRIMPEVIRHRGFSNARILENLFLSPAGIFGIALGVSSTFVFLFILFGAFLDSTGTGEFFINLAKSLLGHVRGGPALIAVFSSGLFGSISGSPAANVVGTGTFTIPMMKTIGYKPEFAGGVEAAASTG
jgi:TRAP-type uncharacterized transport system fused permease subunit